MKPIVNFEDCLHDSPRFRNALEENEVDLDSLESKLEKLVKLCTSMVEAGKSYLATKVNFVNGIWDLVMYFRDDTLNVSALHKLIQVLQEIDKYQTILLEQAKRAVCKNLNNFIQTDIRKAKETKRCFEKCSDELDQALAKNTQTSRTKPHECEDANNLVTASKSMFQHTALDYVSQISLLQAKKRHEILDSLLSYVHAYVTFFHQGSDLCADVDPFVKQLEKNLGNIRDETKQLEKSMDERHSLVGNNCSIQKTVNGQLEGYLFKRTSNTFKTWKRRWFVIQNHQLVYCKRSKDGTEMTVMEEDLKLCTVKPVLEVDRRFCFEILSPTKQNVISRRPTRKRSKQVASTSSQIITLRSHVLQAESEEMYNCWISALQSSIDAALHNNLHYNNDNDRSKEKTVNSDNTNDNCAGQESSSSSKPKSIWEDLTSIPGNELCCDCNSPQPQWASINLGIILCIDCSGIHRSLGVHYSKVRSLRLDDWDPELIKIMKEFGNSFVNKLYEGNVVENIATKPTSDSPSHVREAWIRAKYVDKAFMAKVLPDELFSGTLSSFRRTKKYSLHLPCSEFQAKRAAGYFETSSASSNERSCEIVDSEQIQTNDSIITPNDENIKVMDNDASSPVSELSKDPNILLYKASGDSNFKQMFAALALGADVNWPNPDDEGYFPLYNAIKSGSVSCCEYLLLNGAKLDSTDIHNRTPLHLAANLGYTGHVCLLLKRGANQTLKDIDEKDALHYAIKNANADIVTLLRLAKLNEEMKESEFGNSDETFNEVVRDFSQRASNNPISPKSPETNS